MINPTRTSVNGVSVLHHYESCKLVAYPDPGSPTGEPWTIGWGHTGPEVYKGLVWTQEKADAVFLDDLLKTERGVSSLVKVPINQGQFDALVCLAYNIGLDIDADTKAEGLGDSTLLRKLNAGDFEGAIEEWYKWRTNEGKVMLGLVRRRASEVWLFKGFDHGSAIQQGQSIRKVH